MEKAERKCSAEKPGGEKRGCHVQNVQNSWAESQVKHSKNRKSKCFISVLLTDVLQLLCQALMFFILNRICFLILENKEFNDLHNKYFWANSEHFKMIFVCVRHIKLRERTTQSAQAVTSGTQMLGQRLSWEFLSSVSLHWDTRPQRVHSTNFPKYKWSPARYVGRAQVRSFYSLYFQFVTELGTVHRQGRQL